MRTWSARDRVDADAWLEAEPEEPEPTAWRPPRRRRAWVPLFILVVGLLVLLYSMQLGSVTTSGYDLQRLEAERNEWRQRNEQLELELAKVQSLAWIEVEAVRRLGMQKAERVTYLEVALPAEAPGDAGSPAAAESAGPQEAESLLAGVLRLWRALVAQMLPPVEAGS